MKTIGDTYYNFPIRKFLGGKKPELCESSRYSRKTKEISIRKLKKWQNSAFLSLRNSRHLLIKAFCGSGKTTLGVVLSLWDVIKNKRKQLFIVPQSHIGDGFCVSGVFHIPDLGVVHLSKPLNFCEDSDNKTEMLVNFLLRDTNYKLSVSEKSGEYAVNGPICMAVATHQCFVAAIDDIMEREKNGEKGLIDKCFNNLSLCIDEAHHVKSGSTKEEKKEENTYNNLGKILEKIIANKNAKVCLMTATFFRGDQGIIVSREGLVKFNRFELEFLEHFQTLDIEKIFVNFEEYQTDPISQIVANIENELNERHLIVVPTGGENGAKWRKFDLDLSRLSSEINKMLLRNGLDPNDVVLDLVTQETQKQNKSILLREPKESYSKDETKNSKIRIVITCMLGREGTDWCPCSRLHNASIEFGSTTLAVQTLGRLFRKFLNKNNVGVTYYIKNFESLESCSKKREYISNRVNAMLALMVIDDLMNPILLPELPSSKHVVHKRTKTKLTKKIPLSKVYDYEDFEKIKKEIMQLQSYQIEFEEESVEEIIKGVVSKYNKKEKVCDSDIVAGFKVFLLRAKSETLRNKGLDIEQVRKAGFDEMVEENKLGGNFWAGVLTGKKLKKFQDLIGKIFWTRKQNIEMLQNMKSVLSKELGRELVAIYDTDADSIKLRKILKDFCDFHEKYNEVAQLENTTIPTQQGVAEKLKISLSVLKQRIKVLNQIAPKGYKFFDKKSKILEKYSPAA